MLIVAFGATTRAARAAALEARTQGIKAGVLQLQTIWPFPDKEISALGAMARMVVVPEINAGSASLIASTINPLVGLTSFLAQLILRKPLIDAATQEFLVDGTWVDPRVTKVEHQSVNTPATTPEKSEELK